MAVLDGDSRVRDESQSTALLGNFLMKMQVFGAKHLVVLA